MRSFPITMTVALLALAGCGGHAADRPATPPPATSPSPTPTGPAPIGTTQHSTDKDVTMAVTVLHVRKVRSRASLGEPSRMFLGVDVRACVVRETKGAVSLGPGPWTVHYANDTEAQPIGEWWDGEFTEPLYPAQRKTLAGQCVRGWIMFRPLKGRPAQVIYAPDQSEPVFWRIP